MDEDTGEGDDERDPGLTVDADDSEAPKVRGLASVVLRGLLGVGVGAGLGAATAHLVQRPIPDGVAIGGALGSVVWGAVGVFLWATYPYKTPK